MSKIKFRAWNKAKKCWELDEWVLSPNGKLLELIHGTPIWVDEDSHVLSQFIGLKDCKRTKEYPEGKEIYEGDILQPKNREEKYYVIEFKDGGFKRKYKVKMKYKGEEWIETKYHENIFADEHRVIGNIYENPELLEV